MSGKTRIVGCRPAMSGTSTPASRILSADNGCMFGTIARDGASQWDMRHINVAVVASLVARPRTGDVLSRRRKQGGSGARSTQRIALARTRGLAYGAPSQPRSAWLRVKRPAPMSAPASTPPQRHVRARPGWNATSPLPEDQARRSVGEPNGMPAPCLHRTPAPVGEAHARWRC